MKKNKKNLFFATNGNQQNSSLTHSSTNSLTITGAVTMNQATSNNQTAAWNINAGSATVTGVITMTEVSTQTSRILITPTILTTQILSVTNKSKGVSFTVSVPSVTAQDLTFDWFLINEVEAPASQ